MTALLGLHVPQRPEWVCRWCTVPYPCPGGRDELVARYGLTGNLGRCAYELLEQAVADRPDLGVAELYDRFVRWTEPAPVRGYR